MTQTGLESLPTPGRALALAVLYDAAETHRAATAVYEALLQDLPIDAQLAATWWRIPLVGSAHLAELAARAIAATNLVIVSVRPEREPSLTLRLWVDSWPPHFRPAAALAVLLADSGDPRATAQWELWLQEIARRRNMLYLSGCPASKPLGSGSNDPATNGRIEPFVHGGLNE